MSSCYLTSANYDCNCISTVVALPTAPELALFYSLLFFSLLDVTGSPHGRSTCLRPTMSGQFSQNGNKTIPHRVSVNRSIPIVVVIAVAVITTIITVVRRPRELREPTSDSFARGLPHSKKGEKPQPSKTGISLVFFFSLFLFFFSTICVNAWCFHADPRVLISAIINRLESGKSWISGNDAIASTGTLRLSARAVCVRL